MRKLLLCVGLFLWVFITGCNEVQLTNLQIREMQAKELQGSFDDTYKATMQVFQDYGYVIKNTERDSGVIQGETAFKKDKNFFWNGLMLNDEATATLEQFGENIVKERISLVRKKKYCSKYVIEDAETIVDATLYQKMYDDIQKEIFVRQNINK